MRSPEPQDGFTSPTYHFDNVLGFARVSKMRRSTGLVEFENYETRESTIWGQIEDTKKFRMKMPDGKIMEIRRKGIFDREDSLLIYQ